MDNLSFVLLALLDLEEYYARGPIFCCQKLKIHHDCPNKVFLSDDKVAFAKLIQANSSLYKLLYIAVIPFRHKKGNLGCTQLSQTIF